ncbi:auxin-responsive protein SAUR78-like [Rutidosis leptorrhynchoides]|uniref:auxin-responsive protein SAUR78-like n=1 Tax=Rutidosis leptorrhynchoides TaxID=125765 RepID=UPI003A995053
MKTINVMLRKCKTLSKQLSRSLSNTSTGSKSSRHDDDHHHDHYNHKIKGGIIWNTNAISSVYANNEDDNSSNEEDQELVFVGSTRKRYVIGSKYLIHPLISALIEKSKQSSDHDANEDEDVLVINCEVVLFDHLLWMIETSDLNVTSDCLDELADLYSL